MIRTLVVDDHPMIRQTLRQYLETSTDAWCVGEAANGVEAVDLALQLKPDVILMDLNLPIKDGISATFEITRSTDARVLVLSALDSEQDVLRSLRAGAHGFITKCCQAHVLLRAIRQVHQGDIIFAPEIAVMLQLEEVNSPDEVRGFLRRLVTSPRVSGRELSVLKGVSRGLTNREIAEELVLQLTTVNTYITRLNRKLGSQTRIEMFISAVRQGLIPSPFHTGATLRSK